MNMNSRALTRFALAASLLFFALVAGAAEVIRFGYLELNDDPRYDERKAFFRTLSRPLGAPFAGAEVALREARFVGQALGVSFDIARVRGAGAPALLAEL
ncbi:MAG: amino acid ABC transporter substrate-binding protein, partial [Thauera aminoaromatica]|nr:amino acid ABC transporter substrate-binding protein [Thauera aminoaromatica]